MVNPKKYLSLLIILVLVLCACIVVSKTVSAREESIEVPAEVQSSPEKDYPQTEPELIEITPEPIEEPAQEPVETETPESSPEVTPEPTPEVTPTPTPIITKNPTNETVAPGNSAYFIAKAEGATSISWFLASPDGSEGINAKDIASKFSESSCTGTDGEMLGVVYIPVEMDGWKVICKFSGPCGDTFSEPAYIYVIGATENLRSLDEVLVLVLNARDPEWTMAQGLSYTKTTGRIADFFYETAISAEEVRNATQKYTQQLSEEHRAAYKARVELVIQYYTGIRTNPDGYTGLLHDSGYEARHWPWDDDRVAACIEALRID